MSGASGFSNVALAPLTLDRDASKRHKSFVGPITNSDFVQPYQCLSRCDGWEERPNRKSFHSAPAVAPNCAILAQSEHRLRSTSQPCSVLRIAVSSNDDAACNSVAEKKRSTREQQ
jgi:hypothetical protein